MAESTSDSEILQTPQVTEKAEDEGGKGKKAIDQVGIAHQSNNVPHMFAPLLLDGPENIESLLLAGDRQCNFEQLVKNMIEDTPKIRTWYAGFERRLSELGRTMDSYSNEDLGWMMARSGLLLLEFLRSLADLQRSNEFFRQRYRQMLVQEAVIKIKNQIPFFVLKKILEWEPDADKCRICHSHVCHSDVIAEVHSILEHAWLKLSPIQYKCGICHDSHVIAGVPLKDDSHLLEYVYENIIRSSDFKPSCKRRKNKRRVRHITLPQAEQLQGKGVKLAPNEEGLLDKICFNRSTLYLPTIKMDSGIACLVKFGAI